MTFLHNVIFALPGLSVWYPVPTQIPYHIMSPFWDSFGRWLVPVTVLVGHIMLLLDVIFVGSKYVQFPSFLAQYLAQNGSEWLPGSLAQIRRRVCHWWSGSRSALGPTGPCWSLKSHQVRKGQKLLALQIGKLYPHIKKHSFQEMGLKKGKGMLQPIILPKQYSTTDLNCQDFNLRCFWLVNQQVIRIHPKSPPRNFYISLQCPSNQASVCQGQNVVPLDHQSKGVSPPQGVPIASYSMCSSPEASRSPRTRIVVPGPMARTHLIMVP